MTSGARADQAGSIPLVLLASIVIGGVIVSLFAVTQSGMRSSERDRDLAAAIHVADAGLQDAFVQLQATAPGQRPACDTDGDGICSGTLQDGSHYRWEYDLLSGRLWRVTSIGEYRNQARVVQADVGQRPLFDAAIVTRTNFEYNGGGRGANFIVGAFGSITTNGTSANESVQQVLLYGGDDQPEPSGGQPITTERWQRMEGPHLPNRGLKAFQEDGVCHPDSEEDVFEQLSDPIERGTYCLTGAPELRRKELAAGDDPVIIYIQGGGLTLPTINEEGPASDLQFFVGAGDVTMSGSAAAAATIYAPNSVCTFNGGTTFDGAMICNDVTLNGNFGFDHSAADISDDVFGIRGWHEQGTPVNAMP